MKRIRKAIFADMDEILSLYESARQFMREVGNENQWTGGYPSREVVKSDLTKGCLYLCEEEEKMLAVFYFAQEDDPTYHKIYGGAWLNDMPYAVIHRLAVSPQARGKGVAGSVLDACFSKVPNLKIDTHMDNKPMQRALEKNGFVRCGIIHILNGDERVAFQKC